MTAEALALADQEIIIPMLGMVQSLNVSVAAAIVLYEAQRQRQLVGMYGTQQLSEVVCQKVLFKGAFPKLKKICDRKFLPYPHIDNNGHIDENKDWRQKVQLAERMLKTRGLLSILLQFNTLKNQFHPKYHG